MGYRLLLAPPAMPEIEVSASAGQGFEVSMKVIQAQSSIQTVVVDFTNHLSGLEDALPHLVELRTLLVSRGGGVLLRCSRAQIGKTAMGGRLESLGFKWEYLEDLPLPPAATFGPKLIATSHQLAQALKRASALSREKLAWENQLLILGKSRGFELASESIDQIFQLQADVHRLEEENIANAKGLEALKTELTGKTSAYEVLKDKLGSDHKKRREPWQRKIADLEKERGRAEDDYKRKSKQRSMDLEALKKKVGQGKPPE